MLEHAWLLVLGFNGGTVLNATSKTNGEDQGTSSYKKNVDNKLNNNQQIADGNQSSDAHDMAGPQNFEIMNNHSGTSKKNK